MIIASNRMAIEIIIHEHLFLRNRPERSSQLLPVSRLRPCPALPHAPLLGQAPPMGQPSRMKTEKNALHLPPENFVTFSLQVSFLQRGTHHILRIPPADHHNVLPLSPFCYQRFIFFVEYVYIHAICAIL